MDRRPIGVFDSGLGGLTGVRALTRILPAEDIIYFGDTSRVPYGPRSKETILKYARQDMNFLCGFDLKAVLVACGTISTTSLTELQAEYPVPIVGVVAPAAKRAVEVTKNKKIGLIATKASIASGAYERVIARCDPDAEVLSEACPLFVPLVEAGRFRPGDPVIETVAREYLNPMKKAGVDTLILGCTHYPLLSEVIGNIMGGGVTLVSSGGEAAAELARMLGEKDALAPEGTAGDISYYVSDAVDGFEQAAALFLQQDMRGMAQQINIENY
jgi:glutamate racemase